MEEKKIEKKYVRGTSNLQFMKPMETRKTATDQLEREVKSARNENSKLKLDKGNLQALNEQNENEIKNLKEEIATLKETISSLKTTNTMLHDKVESLQATNNLM